MKYDIGTYGYIALKDLESAKDLLKIENFNMSVVESQQAIEKVLKQYIQEHADEVKDVSIMKSHKLQKLLRVTGKAELQKYYDLLGNITDARYPGPDYTLYTLEDATKYVRIAQGIVDIITATSVSTELNRLEL